MRPLELAFDVACAPARAFDLWARRTSAWWPTSHSVSGDPGIEVVIEPGVGGRIYERTPAGDEHVWGDVRAWDPPHRLAYTWHLRFDAADATEVEVTFTAAEAGTTVRIVHRGWERLGAAGRERRERNRAGWAGVVPRFQATCAAAAS